MKTETQGKTLVLLRWDGEKGVYHRYILNEAIKQTVEGEKHYIANQYIGTLSEPYEWDKKTYPHACENCGKVCENDTQYNLHSCVSSSEDSD